VSLITQHASIAGVEWSWKGAVWDRRVYSECGHCVVAVL
jgi:hypothetical protein